MVPNGYLESDMIIYTYPDFTYRLDYISNIIESYCDGLQAVYQSIFKILNTKKGEHLIYSNDYGIDFSDLFGKPYAYIIPEAKRRIKEALIYDERIKDVFDFSFTEISKELGGGLSCSFYVQSEFGNVAFTAFV